MMFTAALIKYKYWGDEDTDTTAVSRWSKTSNWTMVFALLDLTFWSLHNLVEGPLTCMLYVKVAQISFIAPLLTVGGALWARSGYEAETS